MASYPIFSQPTGPKIDISLFPEAMKAGAAVGNAVKTSTQAVAEGVTEAIKSYEAYETTALAQEQTQLENEKLKAQIELAPLETQIKQQELALKTAEAQLAQQTQADNLKLKLAETQQKISILNGQRKMDQALTSPQFDPRIFDDLDVMTALNSDHNYNKAVFNQLYGTGKLTPEQEEAYKYRIDAMDALKLKESARQADLKAAKARADALDKDYGKVLEDGTLRALHYGKSQSDFARRIEAYPSGQKQIDPKTGNILKDYDQSLGGAVDFSEYQVFDNGKFTGVTIKPETFAKLYAFKDSYKNAYPVLIDPTAATPQGASGGAPQVQTTPTTPAPIDTNQNIVIQRSKQFESLAKNPPPGIAGGALEDRLKVKKEEIRQRFAVAEPTGNVRPISYNPTEVPSSPPTAASALEKATSLPVTLNTEVVYTPRPEVWSSVNNNPLLSNEMAIVKGLATVESGGKEDAISPTGVRGLLQVTEATANQYGLDRNIPEQNLLAGKKYLFDQLVAFNGDLRLALTAYNAGPGVVREAVREAQSTDWLDVKDALKNILSDKKFKEVEDYADRVISAASHYVQPGDRDAAFIELLADNGLLRSVPEVTPSAKIRFQ